MRWLVGCFLAALFSPAGAQPQPDAAHARVNRVHEQLTTAARAGDLQVCRDLAPAFLRDPPDDWSHLALLVWQALVSCDGQPGGAWERQPPSAAQLREAWAPVFRHFARMPVEQRLANDETVDAHVVYWRHLRYFDGPGNQPRNADVADAEEAATVDSWYARAAAQPPDPLAVASLTRLGQAVYGMRWLTAWMAVQQQRLADTLGPGHPATLHMLRSRIFAARAHDRPAEALALSDDYAARLARHRPDDVRLAMANRSERIGLLAALGRLADAVDEGRVLLHWLQQRQPQPHGSIMRTAVNLAGVALDMGDAQGAEALARVSLDAGRQADSHDRDESIVAERLLHQARLAQGDESAGPALKAVLQRIRSQDVGGEDAQLALVHWARRRGDADTERWAAALIDEVARHHATALHGARALPLLLQAERLPPGTEPGQQAAAAALAHGLAADASVAEVKPLLELSRQVQPQQPDGAAWLCKRAAQDLLDWRQLLPEQQADQPRLWLAEHETDLRRCIGLLIDLGRLGEAEQVLGVLREEELHEFRRRSRGAATAPPRLPALGFTPDEQHRNARLQPLRTRLQREAQAARARADAQPDQRLRRGGTDPEADAVVADAAGALRDISLQPRAGGATAVSPSARPHAGHARISYALQAGVDGEAWALVDSATRTQRVRLPVRGAELARAVAALRSEIGRSGAGMQANVPAPARQLHRWLMEPLAAALRGARHLHIVPDGVLRYLPFAALHDGRRYLVETHDLSLALAGHDATPAPADPRPLRTQVAAFGLSQASATHSALPGVRDELAALRRVPGADVQLALDAQFTRASLEQALRRQPQVVHLASHFVLAPASEEDSYLALGDGQRLSLRELRQLPWAGVRLALLSACDSALPLDQDASTQGREWAGFAAALQRAGVASVLATLWRIDDDSAAQWVAGFYDRWARTGARTAPSATLLAQAQRQWLQQHRRTGWSHPRHWAGFVWMGR